MVNFLLLDNIMSHLQYVTLLLQSSLIIGKEGSASCRPLETNLSTNIPNRLDGGQRRIRSETWWTISPREPLIQSLQVLTPPTHLILSIRSDEHLKGNINLLVRLNLECTIIPWFGLRVEWWTINNRTRERVGVDRSRIVRLETNRARHSAE